MEKGLGSDVNSLIVETLMNASEDIKRRMITYFHCISSTENNDKQNRNISIIQPLLVQQEKKELLPD